MTHPHRQGRNSVFAQGEGFSSGEEKLKFMYN